MVSELRCRRDLSAKSFYEDRFSLSGKTHLQSEPFAGDVDVFASDDNDLLTVEGLLGDDGRKATYDWDAISARVPKRG